MPKVKVLKPFKSKFDGASLKKKDEGKTCNLTQRDFEEISKRSGGPYVQLLKDPKASYRRNAKTDEIETVDETD
jgi:hypothetical protein